MRAAARRSRGIVRYFSDFVSFFFFFLLFLLFDFFKTFFTFVRVRQIFLYACARVSLGSEESFETRLYVLAY